MRLKQRLEGFAREAGLRTRSTAKGTGYTLATRIAIEELEAWFFGDWQAVRAAYPRVDPNVPSQAKYRASDAIRGGTWQALERLLQTAGYFTSGFREVEAARTIAANMEPERNESPSFRRFVEVIAELGPA
jgi:hypothetical protein